MRYERVIFLIVHSAAIYRNNRPSWIHLLTHIVLSDEFARSCGSNRSEFMIHNAMTYLAKKVYGLLRTKQFYTSKQETSSESVIY